MSIAVRRATTWDLGDILALERERFAQPWTLRAIAEEMDRGIALVAVDPDQRVVGYAIGVTLGPLACRLARIEARLPGPGEDVTRALLAAFAEEARRQRGLGVWLEMSESEREAMDTCEQAGFRCIGRFFDHYGRGRDMLRFALPASAPLRAASFAGVRPLREPEGPSDEPDEEGEIRPELGVAGAAVRAQGRRERFLSRARQRSANPGLVSILDKVSALLIAQDYGAIEQGIEILASISDPEVIDALLADVAWRRQLTLGGIFDHRDRGFSWNRYAVVRLIQEFRGLSAKAADLIRRAPEEILLKGAEYVPSELEFEPLNLKGLEVFRDVKAVAIEGCKTLPPLDALSALPSLERFALRLAPPLDLNELSLPSLKALRYEAQRLAPGGSVSLSGIERFPRLESLAVLDEEEMFGEWHSIYSIDEIEACVNLRELIIQGNQLVKADPLRGLVELRTPLERLPSLKRIYVSRSYPDRNYRRWKNNLGEGWDSPRLRGLIRVR